MTERKPWLDDPAVEEQPWANDPIVSEPLPDIPQWSEQTTNTDEWGSSRFDKTASIAADIGKDAVALGELGLTVATAGIGEILGGFSAATGMLLGKRPDEAAEHIEWLSDAMTFQPKTSRGKMLLEDVAAPLAAIEQGASDIAWNLSMGNPTAAAFIKSALVGAPELLLPSKGSVNAVRTQRTLARKAKEIEAIADDLGVRVDSENMGADIVEAANRMTPSERAANAPALREAMLEASNAAKARKDALYESARQTDTWVETRAVSDLSADIRTSLIDRGYDLEEMPIVRKRLADLETTGPDGTIANLSEFEKVRKRVNANRSASPSENSALNQLKRQMDGFLDNEFNKIAIGEGSAIGGDMAGVQAWKSAREAHATWKRNFSEDKAIAQLIKMEATPEQYRQWLMGASALNARKEAASTIGRMRNVLGDNHPAIEGIRQDFLFEVAEPLLKAQPNFGQFVRNYDAIIRKNPSLVKELGLKGRDLDQLYTFAQVQSKIPPGKVQFAVTDLTRGLAQFFVGHNIAKASLRVNMARNITNMLIGTDRISKKQILAELAGARQGSEIAIPRASPLAAQFIAGAALTGLPDTQED